MSWLFIDPRLEKLKYEEKTGSIDGIVTTGQFFDWNWDLITLFAGWNFEFRFLLDMFLFVYGGVWFGFMDWFSLDMTSLFPGDHCAKYSLSRYGEGRYDPPDISGTDIENLAWELTYHTTDHDSLERALSHRTLRNYMDSMKKIIVPKGIPDYYFEVIEKCVAAAEAKLQTLGYWDVAVWGGNLWSDGEDVKVRAMEDWVTDLMNETIWVFETWWDWGQWDYARWMDDDIVERVQIDPEWVNKMGPYLDGKIKAFLDTIDPIYSTVRRLRAKERMLWVGGGSIAQMEYFRSKVKQYLKKLGLSSIQYGGYYSFALELVNLGADSARQFQRWKKLLTEDDLVEKYVDQGLNRDILNGVRRLL